MQNGGRSCKVSTNARVRIMAGMPSTRRALCARRVAMMCSTIGITAMALKSLGGGSAPLWGVTTIGVIVQGTMVPRRQRLAGCYFYVVERTPLFQFRGSANRPLRRPVCCFLLLLDHHQRVTRTRVAAKMVGPGPRANWLCKMTILLLRRGRPTMPNVLLCRFSARGCLFSGSLTGVIA
jgi:hypothetical protein